MRRIAELPRAYLVSAVFITLLLSIYLLGVARSEPVSSWHSVMGSSALRASVAEQPQQDTSSLDATLNETLGFQKIFVINMKSRTDNRDQVSLAASLAGLQVDFIDGVTDFDMDHAIPVRPEDLAYQGKDGGGFGKKTYNSWRAHVNAIRMIVEQNLTSALIMEDDADYDIRIKSQVRDFARATRLLLQPLQGTTDKFLDPTLPRQGQDDVPFDIDIDNPAHPITEPSTSPYGDINRWDVLWMGHCGSYPAGPGALQHPLGRVVMQNDPSSLSTQHYDPGYGDRRVWPSYPNNTRLYYHAKGTICNLAYGVSLPGARRLLYQVGIKNMTGTTDTILHQVCDGGGGEGWWYKKRTCMGVLPALFQHHRPQAYPRAYTQQIRQGTRANFEKLIDGEYDDLYDAYPDGEPMALHFHHRDALERYHRYLEDPWPQRLQEEKSRGVVAQQERLRKLEENKKNGKIQQPMDHSDNSTVRLTKYHEQVS